MMVAAKMLSGASVSSEGWGQRGLFYAIVVRAQFLTGFLTEGLGSSLAIGQRCPWLFPMWVSPQGCSQQHARSY